MSDIDWTEWAAICLAYNDARRAAQPMTLEDLSLAWEGHKLKRPVLQDTDPRGPKVQPIRATGCRGCSTVGFRMPHDPGCYLA